MKQKTKQAWSPFVKDLIMMIISISILVFSSLLVNDIGKFSMMQLADIFIIVLSAGFIFFHILAISSSLDSSINLKYKIVHKDYEYKALVLKPWFLFIFSWQPVEKKWHSYSTRNLFGATMDSGFSTAATFRSEEAAKEAIEKYKYVAQQQRKRYFSRPKKETITIIDI